MRCTPLQFVVRVVSHDYHVGCVRVSRIACHSLCCMVFQLKVGVAFIAFFTRTNVRRHVR